MIGAAELSSGRTHLDHHCSYVATTRRSVSTLSSVMALASASKTAKGEWVNSTRPQPIWSYLTSRQTSGASHATVPIGPGTTTSSASQSSDIRISLCTEPPGMKITVPASMRRMLPSSNPTSAQPLMM